MKVNGIEINFKNNKKVEVNATNNLKPDSF